MIWANLIIPLSYTRHRYIRPENWVSFPSQQNNDICASYGSTEVDKRENTKKKYIKQLSLWIVYTSLRFVIWNYYLCFSPLSHLFITVLHSLTLVCGAHKQEPNTLKLELNGYGRKPIVALRN